MSVVQSDGQLTAIEPDRPRPVHGSSGLHLYGSLFQDYAAIYRTQQNVRTCVSFLARNLAQIGIKVYRKISPTDRDELLDHGLTTSLQKPNPDTTPYRAIDALTHDVGIYGNHFWIKLRVNDRVGLLRWPATMVRPIGSLMIEKYELRGRSGKRVTLDADQVVHFRVFNPDDPRIGLSPLETLRRTLAEEAAAGQYREHFWQNAARMDGVLQRPKDAAALSTDARQRLREEWKALYAGAEQSGNTAILEEGMEFKEMSFSAKDAEYMAARKLNREEVAAAFHIPLPMVGILEHATFSNITEQHKNLYQDSLAPWTEMIEQDIELQLLPEFDDMDGVYCEFNIKEKMKGSFEEETKSLQSAVGAPYMTPNEARARQNLPRIDDPQYDRPVKPLNVLYGGQASPRDTDPEKTRGTKARFKSAITDGHIDKHMEVLTDFFERQQASVLGKLGIKAAASGIDDVFDSERWNNELSEDLLALSREAAKDAGEDLASDFDGEFDVDDVLEYLITTAQVGAENINLTTRDQLATALGSDDLAEQVKNVFAVAISARVPQIATSRVTNATSFGATEAAKGVGLTEKTWVVTSGNPRSSHAAMSGETVAIDEVFSNGGKWPGDPTLPVEEVAGCSCEVQFS